LVAMLSLWLHDSNPSLKSII